MSPAHHCMSGGGFSGFAFDPGWSNVPPGI
jgi:hypothetical protein